LINYFITNFYFKRKTFNHIRFKHGLCARRSHHVTQRRAFNGLSAALRRSCEPENMSKLEILKSLVTQRLTSAAGDISGLFESTMADEEDELSDLRKANARQRKLLDAVHDPDIRIHRAGPLFIMAK